MKFASVASRIALTSVDEDFHARLRGHFGLTPAGGHDSRVALAYCGREFRVYPSMSVGEAARFYAALHERWNAAWLRDELARAGLGDAFEVRRMKRAFQRALVLAFAMAAEPTVLIVEGAEEFDEPRASGLLERSIRRVSSAVVTYAGDVVPPEGLFSQTLPAADYDVAWA